MGLRHAFEMDPDTENTREDDRSIFMDTPIEELSEGAYRLQKQFCGNHIDLCTIVNGRSGRCGEDCKYCAQV